MKKVLGWVIAAVAAALASVGLVSLALAGLLFEAADGWLGEI